MPVFFFRNREAACGVCIALFLCAPAHVFAAAISAADLVVLANADRAQYHLPVLKIDSRLTLAAQEKADDMAAKGYFAHVSPEGTDPWYWFSLAGYDFRFAGENLAEGFSNSDDVNAAWMASASHRANILNANYTDIGIATAAGMYEGRPVVFAVEEFGSPRPP